LNGRCHLNTSRSPSIPIIIPYRLPPCN